MLMVGVLIGGGALLIGIPSPFALGPIFGLAEFVPVVGPVARAVPVLLVAVGQGWEMTFGALGLVVIVQQVESNLIMPLASGHAVQLPPAVGLFAVWPWACCSARSALCSDTRWRLSLMSQYAVSM